MNSNSQIKEHLQTRLGRYLKMIIVVDDIALFNIEHISEGVLIVWPEWSPHGVINCMQTIQYLHDQHYQGIIYVIDIDDIITAKSQINIFGHVLHGWGEIFMVKQGVITEEFLGKESFAQFKASYETIKL